MEVRLLYKMSSFVGQHHAITYDIVTKLKSLFVYYVIILTWCHELFFFFNQWKMMKHICDMWNPWVPNRFVTTAVLPARNTE